MEEKFSKGAKVTGQDLEYIDKMAHALKCLKTYEAMDGASEYGGDSYARGRSRTTGRYISRDGGYRSGVEYGRDMDPYWDRR